MALGLCETEKAHLLEKICKFKQAQQIDIGLSYTPLKIPYILIFFFFFRTDEQKQI